MNGVAPANLYCQMASKKPADAQPAGLLFQHDPLEHRMLKQENSPRISKYRYGYYSGGNDRLLKNRF